MILDEPEASLGTRRELAGTGMGEAIALSGAAGREQDNIAGCSLRWGWRAGAVARNFAIVQPYDPPEVRFPVLHVDLYRLDDPSGQRRSWGSTTPP